MYKHYPIRILLISLCLSLTACSFFLPDEEPIVFKASAPVTPVFNQAPALPANPDECKLKCANKAGLKKKLCQKKCQLAIKKEAAKAEASSSAPSLAPVTP